MAKSTVPGELVRFTVTFGKEEQELLRWTRAAMEKRLSRTVTLAEVLREAVLSQAKNEGFPIPSDISTVS